MQGETGFAKEVRGFKSTEILPPAVSGAALEYLTLRKTTAYAWTRFTPWCLFRLTRKVKW